MEDPLVGQILGGQWRVDARLWTGGMATTYAATHRNGDRVAIKLLSSIFSQDAEARTQFLREGYVANAIGHRGAVRVLDDDATPDSVFLVMELVDGESLEAQRTRRGGTLPVDEVVSIADGVLEIVAAAHGRGIVHRDLKPENIFVTREGRLKILDFGIASKPQGSGVVDGQEDLRSLGATFFLLLAGDAPRGGAEGSLQSLAPWLPVRLVDVIERALAPVGWADAASMHAALQSARDAIARDGTSPEEHVNEDRTQLRPPMKWPASAEAIPVGPSSEPTLNIPAQPNRVYARGFVPAAASGGPVSERTIAVLSTTEDEAEPVVEETKLMAPLQAPILANMASTSVMAPLPLRNAPPPAPPAAAYPYVAAPQAPPQASMAPIPTQQLVLQPRPVPLPPLAPTPRRAGGRGWWTLLILIFVAIALAIAARFAYERMMPG